MGFQFLLKKDTASCPKGLRNPVIVPNNFLMGVHLVGFCFSWEEAEGQSRLRSFGASDVELEGSPESVPPRSSWPRLVPKAGSQRVRGQSLHFLSGLNLKLGGGVGGIGVPATSSLMSQPHISYLQTLLASVPPAPRTLPAMMLQAFWALSQCYPIWFRDQSLPR